MAVAETAASARTVDGPRLRVATWNVHGFVGADGRRDVDRCLEVMARLDPDVLALQEADSCRRDDAEGGRPLERAAARLQATAVPGPTMCSPGREFGNAVLSRPSVASTRRHRLEVGGSWEPRGVVDLTLDLAGGPLRLVATHLGLGRRERRRQLSALARLVAAAAAADSPTVVCGDFNSWLPFSAAPRCLTRLVGPSPVARTFPARWPLLPLDRIFVAPSLAVGSAGVFKDPLARLASDHLPLWVDLLLG